MKDPVNICETITSRSPSSQKVLRGGKDAFRGYVSSNARNVAFAIAMWDSGSFRIVRNR